MSEVGQAKSMEVRRTRVEGIFYRIVFAATAEQVMAGVRAAEGRFHHNSQPALYVSPTVESAVRAMDRYQTPGDPPRVAIPLSVGNASVVDLRDRSQCAALDVDPRDALDKWWLQRQAGTPANSWRVSDAVRASRADGMLYPSRSCAARWHLVLFRWNTGEGATVAVAGPPLPLGDDAAPAQVVG